MGISSLKGEEALHLLGDLIEPAVSIMRDKNVVNAARSGNILDIVKLMCKDHAKEVNTIMAIAERQDPATYEVGFFELPNKLVALLNEPEVMQLFMPQGQTEEKSSSGSASENIKAQKKQSSS